MWDPAYNNSSAQQRSSDLTTRPATDRDTLHSTAIATFGAKQHTESATVEERYPAADVQLAGYTNHDSDMSYQNGYPSLPSSQQQPNTGAADYVMRSSEEDIMPPPSLPLSREPFALGLSTALLPVTGTNTPISHNLQQRHTSNDTNNNIPLEIDTTTTNTSARPLSNSYPVWKHSDIQQKAQVQPITLVSPESYNLLSLPPHQDSMSEQQDQPSPPPAAGQPLLRPPSLSTTSSLPKSPKSTRDTSPCIARLTIPPSHMSLFHDALTSPPDPDLKIRKKTVRFTKTSLTNSSPPPSPRSEQRHERRESEGSGSNSTSGKATSSSSHPSSSKSTFGNSKPSSVPQIIEKDPEERMAELMELKQMKVRQEDLMHLKDQVFQTGQNLEEKQTILDEVRAERKVLHSELNRYIAMVKQVQKDLELAAEAETQLTKERDQLSQYLNQLRDHDFKVLKEEVDQLRAKKGLRPLQSLEQEQEEVMGRYLEERRGQWREDGVAPQDPSSSSLSLTSLTNMNNSGSGSSLADAAAVDTSSRRQGAGSSSSSSGAAAAASSRSSSRSHTSTAAPSTSRGKDRDGDGRSSRSHLSSSSSTRGRNHSSSKSKHEQSSSSSRHNNSRSSSRRQSSRSRSRSPVISSSLSSRDERSKKRSRY